MPVIRTPPIHYGHRSGIGAYAGFLHGFDSKPYYKTYPPYADGLYSSSDAEYRHYEDSQLSLSQWIGSTPLSSELEVYEQVSRCPPPVISQPRHDDGYDSYEEPVEGNPLPWPYDGASTSSNGPVYAPFISESGVPFNAMSPMISVTTSSPRSESEALSPEFSNVFDFDYGTSFTGNSSWSGSLSSPLSTSPSPSRSSMEPLESNPSTSRDPSPVNNETEKHDRRRFPCLILGCNRRFTSQYTLKVHMEAHKPKPRVTFPCTEGCSERFSRQHDRLRHEVAKHGKVCEFSCEDCGRFFSTKKTLGNHKCPVAQGSTRWVTS